MYGDAIPKSGTKFLQKIYQDFTQHMGGTAILGQGHRDFLK